MFSMSNCQNVGCSLAHRVECAMYRGFAAAAWGSVFVHGPSLHITSSLSPITVCTVIKARKKGQNIGYFTEALRGKWKKKI